MKDFLRGREPREPADLKTLWKVLVQGQPIPLVETAESPLQRCLQALAQPDTLRDWPEDLLEGDDFPGFLARLLAWTRLLQAVEDSPVHLEVQLTEQLELCHRHQDWLEVRADRYPIVRAWYWREKARLVGMLEGDPLPWLEKSLRQAADLQQWHELEKVRAFLVDSGEEVTAHRPDWQKRRLERFLAALPALAAADSREKLTRALLENLLSLLPLDSVLWLRKDDDWQVVDWLPRELHPRYSRSLVDECRQNQELSWGRPDQMQASRSILLAEVQSVLALPVNTEEVVFAWQSSKQPWLDEEQAEVAQFLVRLAATLQRKNVDLDLARSHLARAQRLHRQWRIVFEQSPLAMAEGDEEGRILDFNPAFARVFGQARAGLYASELLLESDQSEDRERLQNLQGHSSQLIRLEREGAPRWYQITDWKVPEQPGFFRILVDVGAEDVALWSDYLEELNHQLASDLHDGAIQLAAAENLSQPSQSSQQHYRELRNCLDAWRSPWLDGSSLEDWMWEALHRHLPECRGQLEMPPVDWPRPRQQTALRIAMAMLQALRLENPPAELQLTFQMESAELGWQPISQLSLGASLHDYLQRRLDVTGGSYQLEPGRLLLTWRGSRKVN